MDDDTEIRSLATGICQTKDGWHIAIEDFDGDVLVHEHAFATEDEAKEAAAELTSSLLAYYREQGEIAYRTDHNTGEIIE